MSEQPLSSDDRWAVTDLIVRYAQCLDTADIDGWRDLWSPDAVLRNPTGSASGRDELQQWISRMIEAGIGSDPLSLVHFLGLPRITGGGDRCAAQTYMIMVNFAADGNLQIPMIALHDDEFIRADGRWWIRRRTISPVLRSTN